MQHSYLPLVWFLWFSLLNQRLDAQQYYVRPKCPLNPLSPHSYLVKLRNGSLTSAHGCILSMTSVLTACSVFDQSRIKDIVAVAGLVKSLASIKDLYKSVCYQKRAVETIECHPKALLSHSSEGFDFAVLTIREPYLVEIGASYPAIFFDNTPDRVLVMIRLMKRESFGHCDAPLFYNAGEEELRIIFSANQHVDVLERGVSCAYASCYFRYPTDQVEQRNCSNYALERLEETQQLCVFLPHIEKFSPQQGSLDWYKGSVLTCNGTIFAMTTEIITFQDQTERPIPNFAGTSYVDSLYMTSIIRVWDFIVTKREEHGSLIPRVYMQDFLWRTEKIEIPPTYVEDPVMMNFSMEPGTMIIDDPTPAPERKFYKPTTKEPTKEPWRTEHYADKTKERSHGLKNPQPTNFYALVRAAIFIIFASF